MSGRPSLTPQILPRVMGEFFCASGAERGVGQDEHGDSAWVQGLLVLRLQRPAWGTASDPTVSTRSRRGLKSRPLSWATPNLLQRSETPRVLDWGQPEQKGRSWEGACVTRDCSSKWEISRSRWSPEHRVPVFTQMSGTIKVRGGG